MAEREDTGSRLLIFVCHGFGGLLVQRALALTSESNSTPVAFQTLRSSTSALIFAGTPHRGIKYDALKVLYQGPSDPPNQLVLDLLQGSSVLQEISSFFRPMLRDFRIINFWERIQTGTGKAFAFVVEELSGAPMLYTTERFGIMSDHANLLRFSSPNDSGFKLVNSALESCLEDSASRLQQRARVEVKDLASSQGDPQSRSQGHNMWQNEITGRAVHLGDVYVYNTIKSGNASHWSETASIPSSLDGYGTYSMSGCQMYKVGRRSSPHFTGRRIQAKMLSNGLASPSNAENRDKHKVAVIYGLGGSGKTQFCLRFAEQHQAR